MCQILHLTIINMKKQQQRQQRQQQQQQQQNNQNILICLVSLPWRFEKILNPTLWCMPEFFAGSLASWCPIAARLEIYHRSGMMHFYLAFFQREPPSCQRISQSTLQHHDQHCIPGSEVHGANMGPTWGRQDPGGPHVGPMNFAIWDIGN